MSIIIIVKIYFEDPLEVYQFLSSHHIYYKDVAYATNKDDEAEHDWDEVLGDDVYVFLLLLGEGYVPSQSHLRYNILFVRMRNSI